MTSRRGFDVSAYDEVRERGPRRRGVLGEHAAASEACKALRSVLPGVDWSALEPADTLVGIPRQRPWQRVTALTFVAALALTTLVLLGS